MPLHGCQHTFEALTLDVFPALFSKLSTSLQAPLPLCQVTGNPGLMPATPGCYVITYQGKALYVGIAKNMRRRVVDHLSGDPSRANLAVRMAAKSLGVSLSSIKRHPAFDSEFRATQQRLLDGNVAWVVIDNPLEMYIFEPYCAMKLDTCEYNYFDTLQILSPKGRP